MHECVQWFPGCALPHWCAYNVDPVSKPGRLVVVTHGGRGEDVIEAGDFLHWDGRYIQTDHCDRPKLREAPGEPYPTRLAWFADDVLTIRPPEPWGFEL